MSLLANGDGIFQLLSRINPMYNNWINRYILLLQDVLL